MRERKIVCAERIDKAFRDADYDLTGYLEQALHGSVSPLDRKKFLAQLEYERKKPDRKEENFWYAQESGKQEHRTMRSAYEHQFARLFYDGERGMADVPRLVSDVIKNLKIDGESYQKRYQMPEVSTANCLETICHVVENLSEGELAKAFFRGGERASEITFYRERNQEELCFRPEPEAASQTIQKESRRAVSFRSLLDKVGGRDVAEGQREKRGELRDRMHGRERGGMGKH